MFTVIAISRLFQGTFSFWTPETLKVRLNQWKRERILSSTSPASTLVLLRLFEPSCLLWASPYFLPTFPVRYTPPVTRQTHLPLLASWLHHCLLPPRSPLAPHCHTPSGQPVQYEKNPSYLFTITCEYKFIWTHAVHSQGRNRTGDLRINHISIRCRVLIYWAKVADESPKIFETP